MIYGLLIHLGRNMWDTPADHLRFDETVWRETTEKMGRVGADMAVIDTGEGLVYPSHPELAVKDPRPLSHMLDMGNGVGILYVAWK